MFYVLRGNHTVFLFLRFFIILDGFMLYYPESEFRDFEQKHHVNIHPKVYFHNSSKHYS